MSLFQPSKLQCELLWILFQAGLHPTLESFATAVVTVRGKSCLPEDPLVKPPSQRKGQPSLASSGESIAAAMYLRKVDMPNDGDFLCLKILHNLLHPSSSPPLPL